MFNTEIIEKPMSIMMLLLIPCVAILPGVALGIFGIFPFVFDGEHSAGWAMMGAGACCFVLGAAVFAPLLLWVGREARTGKAGPLVEEIATQLGAEASLGSLVFSMVVPRVKGEVDGRAIRFELRRQGGILGPRTPGRRHILGWYASLNVQAALPVKVGFAPVGASVVGVGLLGLKGKTDAHGLQAWTGASPVGAALVQDAAVGEAAKAALVFPAGRPMLLRVGPSAVHIDVVLQQELTAEDAVAWIRAVVSLAAACEASVAQSGA